MPTAPPSALQAKGRARLPYTRRFLSAHSLVALMRFSLLSVFKWDLPRDLPKCIPFGWVYQLGTSLDPSRSSPQIPPSSPVSCSIPTGGNHWGLHYYGGDEFLRLRDLKRKLLIQHENIVALHIPNTREDAIRSNLMLYQWELSHLSFS